jgi:hypothetical protein
MADCYDCIEKSAIRFQCLEAIKIITDKPVVSTPKPTLSVVTAKAFKSKKPAKKKTKANPRNPVKTSKEIYDFISYN